MLRKKRKEVAALFFLSQIVVLYSKSEAKSEKPVGFSYIAPDFVPSSMRDGMIPLIVTTNFLV